MKNSGYTIRIFVSDGDPDGVKVIDRMNWTGAGISFPRASWPKVRIRKEFEKAGVYILVGHIDGDGELPRIYVGEGDGIRERIEHHYQNKEFWSWGIAFTSSSGLNKAHVQWLEFALVRAARDAGLCVLDNGNTPQGPVLAENEEADVWAFFQEMLKILPLAELRVFEKAKALVSYKSEVPLIKKLNKAWSSQQDEDNYLNTIIVPANRHGFEEVFIKERSWYAIRIAGAMVGRIKYIAAYQTQPISAVTHLAEVKQIERYGDGGKYKIIFMDEPKEITPIPYADALRGAMQGPRYTTLSALLQAKKISDL
jgi:hypothetical protein